MDLEAYLKKHGVRYVKHSHAEAFTAQELAAVEHEPGRFVAKPVIVRSDGKLLMAVLPASHRINMDRLAAALGAEQVELASESDFAGVFGDCELGAEPPIGAMFDLPMIVDQAIADDEHILFQAGSHSESITMRTREYLQITQPQIARFAEHLT
jgi:Ala-tRNA(Pro) deacylase